MCLLIHRTPGAPTIALGWLEDFWRRNEDGFGAWWINDAKTEIVVRKTLVRAEVEPIVREIERLNVEAGLHWRMATHGACDETNVHPFTITAGSKDGHVTTVLGHNGVLSRWAPDKYGQKQTWEGPNDTAIFSKRIVKPLVTAFGMRSLFTAKSSGRELLEAAIGGNNRLLLTNLRLGFARFGDEGYQSWTDWRGLKMSNTYAWSATSREKEDGPKSTVAPFFGPTMKTTAWPSGSTNTSAAPCKNSDDGTLTVSASNYLCNGSHGLMPLVGGPVRMVRCGPTIETPYIHWIYSDKLTGTEIPWSDAQDRIAEDARHRPLADVDLTGTDGIAAAREVVEQELAQVAEVAEVEAKANLRVSVRGDTGELTDTDLTLSALQGMSFIAIADWCQREPEEAAVLIQAFVWSH